MKFQDMKMKILDKYILSQVVVATFACILLFVVIWIAPETLLKVIKRTLAGTYTLSVAGQILLLEVPKILNKALPVGLLLGALFTFDKLSKDSEITVMRSFGISFSRIVAPVVVFSLFITTACFVVYDKFIPMSVKRYNVIQHENPSSHFVYTFKDDTGTPQKIMIVSNFDNDSIEKLVVLNFSGEHYSDANILSNILIAENATYDGNRWILPSAEKYELNKDGIFDLIRTIKDVEVVNGQKARDVYKLMTYSVKRERELNNDELFSYITLLKKEHLMDEYCYMLNKFLQRYFHSLICILFAILGCLLGFSQPREQRLIGFTVAIAIVFSYYITLPFFDMLAEKRVLTPYLTSTIQPLAILAVTYIVKKIKDV